MTPLSPANESRLNIATTPEEDSFEQRYEVHTRTETPTNGGDGSSDYSTTNSSQSTTLTDNTRDQENMPPSPSNSSPSPPSAPATAIKPQRHSRVMSGTAPSPLKILAGAETTEKQARSPLRKTLISPDKRFPIRVSTSTVEPQRPADNSPPRERTISLDDAMRDNEGLKHAIDIFEDDEDETTGLDSDDHPADETTTVTVADAGDQQPEMGHGYEDQSSLAGPDDTMISTFSTFSAVPDLTKFARLGQTPSKLGGMTPRGRPETVHETPRQHAPQDGNNTTNLLDFTESQRFPHKSPSRRGTASPNRGNPNATPARQMSNLLDFDIPPLPTPRSIPTITPRELESLKSNFLSEISSLKASLSGKEAEVLSLKTAVGDAEKRVGESLEQAREERSLREQLAEEKDGWEARSREMESLLHNVKEEIVHSTRERDEFESKLAESEARREAAETMAQEAESKLAGMRAGKITEKDVSTEKKAGAAATSKEVEIAVERVARELHALYKGKHETKVAALKKSYESRWEKKVRELEVKIEELTEENEKLRQGRDATMTRVDPAQAAMEEELKAQAIRDSAHIKELSAEVEKLEAVVTTIKEDNNELRSLLAQERVEKGELVQLAEEMMQVQNHREHEEREREREQREREHREQMYREQQYREQQYRDQQYREQQQREQERRDQERREQERREQERREQQQQQRRTAPPVSSVRTPGRENSFRSSIGRGSGLKAPGSIAARGSMHERAGSTGPAAPKGLPRPRPMSEFGPRSGIMSSIEKMGNYRGRGD